MLIESVAQNAVVRVNGENTEPCIIGRGVRQGCLLSPTLFNIYAEAIEREGGAIEDVDEGLKVGGQLLQTIKFADAQAVVADTERGRQRMMDKMNESVERHGMKINGKKTKVMKIGRSPSPIHYPKWRNAGTRLSKQFQILGNHNNRGGQL